MPDPLTPEDYEGQPWGAVGSWNQKSLAFQDTMNKVIQNPVIEAFLDSQDPEQAFEDLGIITETTGDLRYAAKIHTHPDATGSVSGFMPASSVTKLAGIEDEATKNLTDAELKDRSTDTGEQPISTVTGLQGELDAINSSVTSLEASVAGLEVGDSFSEPNLADLPSTSNATGVTEFANVYNDSVSDDNNGRYFREDGDTTWTKVPGDLTERVVSLEAFRDEAEPLLPVVEDIEGLAGAVCDPARRPWLKFNLDGTTSISLDEESIPVIGLSNLDADLVARLPADDYYTDYLGVIVDQQGRPMLTFSKDGYVDGKIRGIQDTDAVIAEVSAARGTEATLNDRLSAFLSPAGLPDQHQWGEWLLRSWAWKRTQLLGGTALRANIAFVGDSWTQEEYRITNPVARALQASYGNGGGGFCGFAHSTAPGFIYGAADSAVISGSKDIGWVVVTTGTETIFALDGAHITSSTAGMGVSLTIHVMHEHCRIHYRAQAGGGVFRYRIDAGSWTSVDTNAADGYGLHTVTLPSSPCALRIEVVSGNVILNGVDIRHDTGAIVHKLGSGGAHATRFAVSTNADHWKAGLAALEVDVVCLMFGTNEQANNIAPSLMAERLDTLITRVREARPLCDVVLMCPAENGLAGTSYSMDQYRDAVYSLAWTRGVAFLDYYKLFGPFADYEYSVDGSTRNLFAVDAIHPNPAGGLLLGDGWLRLAGAR